MPVIKRYPNRKLYDTEAKQYITLEQIADLIRRGQDVKVIDNVSGEDLTAVTLTQIIFEQEKKQSGFLPHTLLSGLIQAGGEGLSALQRTLASPMGLLHQVDDEIRRRVHTLVRQGELSEGEGRSLIEKLLGAGSTMHAGAAFSERDVERLLEERQVPSRSDVDRLMEELEALSNKIDELSGQEPNLPQSPSKTP